MLLTWKNGIFAFVLCQFSAVFFVNSITLGAERQAKCDSLLRFFAARKKFRNVASVTNLLRLFVWQKLEQQPRTHAGQGVPLQPDGARRFEIEPQPRRDDTQGTVQAAVGTADLVSGC